MNEFIILDYFPYRIELITSGYLQSHQWKPHLTAPKSPLLQTSLRARPPKIKSSEELEKEELENIPHFKARPLNRKVRYNSASLPQFFI